MILGVLGLGLEVGQDMLIVIECAQITISTRQKKKKRDSNRDRDRVRDRDRIREL
jgi:hypothetical protein